MHTTLLSLRRLPFLLLAVSLLASCSVTTKKNFLGEPVQEVAASTAPAPSFEATLPETETLSRKPGLDSAEATGVQKLLNIITPYRINIQQGNFISQEMLTRIQPGMTPEQVRFALGTPLLADIFHAGRWDYVFRLQKPNGQITNNRVIIYFKDNRVARILSDTLPDETQYLKTIAGSPPKKTKAAASESAAVLPVATPLTQPDKPADKLEEPVYEDATEPKPSDKASSAQKETLLKSDQQSALRQSSGILDTEPQVATPATPPSGRTAPAPAPVKTRQILSAEKTEPVPVVKSPKKPAVTVQPPKPPIKPEEDFMAAPNAADQLHQLMQQP